MRRKTKEARLFDEAAEFIGARHYGDTFYSCWVVAHVEKGTDPFADGYGNVHPWIQAEFSPLRKRYTRAFDHFSEAGRRDLCFHTAHERIVAMGFAAAMAETGDL